MTGPLTRSIEPCLVAMAPALSWLGVLMLAGCEAPGADAAPGTLASSVAEGGGCEAQAAPAACGDPCGEGVVVTEDVEVNTVWDCPLYTLPAPVFVRGSGADHTELVIAPGTVIRGRAGDVSAGRLPGALIVTRSARLEARGTRLEPIVFTSARPLGERAPGDWGGVVLLGRAPTNVPSNFENSGNLSGEMFVEGLPRSADTTYGAPLGPPAGADAGASLDGALGGAALGDAGAPPTPPPDADHDCGTLRFVRIEFAGFEVGDTNELNGLTVAGCGRATVLDYLQVHLGSDDGIEFFGGAADLRHAVITGARDDALDWDQGWRGRVQFLAVGPHELGAEGDGTDESDSALEGDGFADAEAQAGVASAPVMSNVTLLLGTSSTRGVRLREGSSLVLENAIVAAGPAPSARPLLEVDDALTARHFTQQLSRVHHVILQGQRGLAAPTDPSGLPYLSEDYLTHGAGARGNTELDAGTILGLLPGAFARSAPSWMPVRGGEASRDWTTPSEDGQRPAFFEASANYRGALDPSGADWTLGWTAYPSR